MTTDQSQRRGILTASFTDIDLLCSTVKHWDLEFSSIGKNDPQNLVGGITQFSLDGIIFGRAHFGLNIEQQGTPPPGYFTFGVPEEILNYLLWRGHHVDYRDILVFPLGGELRSTSNSNFDVYTISAPEEIIREICDRLGIRRFNRRITEEIVRPDPESLGVLRGLLRKLLNLSRPGSIFDAHQIVEQLVWLWLGDRSRKQMPVLRSHSLTIRKAMERMLSADWDHISASELRAYTGVSEKSLELTFHKYFHMTPAAFIKARKLAAIRLALKKRSHDHHLVGDTAAQFGFWHSGQFAADYHRAFGELPSDTLKNTIE